MPVTIHKSDIAKAMVDNLELTQEAAQQAGYKAEDFDLSAFMLAQSSGHLHYYEVRDKDELVGHAITMAAPNPLMKNKEATFSVWNFYLKPERSKSVRLPAVRLLHKEADTHGCQVMSIQEGNKIHKMEVKRG